jgi:DNA-binding SARP family transcriptional activator
VLRLRRTLGTETVAGDRVGYSIRLDADDLDAAVFERLLRTARDDGDPASFRAALQLWRGDALDGIDSPLVRHGATVWDERRMAAIEDWVEAESVAGNDRVLVAELAGLVQRFPLRERLRGQLMTALHRTGRRADALAEYRLARKVLIDELGIEPGPELRAVHDRILAGPDPPAAVRQVSDAPPPPNSQSASTSKPDSGSDS